MVESDLFMQYSIQNEGSNLTAMTVDYETLFSFLSVVHVTCLKMHRYQHMHYRNG